MSGSARRAAAAAILVAGAFISLRAATPVFWRVSTQAELLRGDPDNVSIDADGRLLLGPSAEVVRETAAPYLWTLVHEGGAVWTGSGNGGAVYRVTADGAARTVLDGEALDVHALVAAPAGGVYAGTSPDGRVVALDAEGPPRPVFDPDEPYIWALAVGPDETLYVGTGNPGRIYRVSPGSAGELFYDTGATHVRSLAVDPDGRVVAGTGSPGQVFRVDPDGRAFVLLDSGYDEIASLRLGAGGTLLAVAASGGAAAPPAAGSGPATGGGTGPTAAVDAGVAASGGATATTLGTKGAVYRIQADGIWDVVWDSDDDTPYDAVAVDAGALLVGTGPNGKIFRVIDDPPTTVLLTRAPAQQVTAFAEGPEGALHYTTANPGTLYRLAPNRAGEGTYLSEVRDARTVATWGTIRWQAMTAGRSTVQVSTRSGNTAMPGDTWSRWSEPYADPAGSAITSPKARYLQWRAVLRGGPETPALLSVTAAYLPRNLAPEITDVTVHEPGQVYQQAFAGGDPPIAGLDLPRDPGAAVTDAPAGGEATPTTLGRQVYRKGLRTFVWKARDQNGDELRFDLAYRAEQDTDWRPLKRATRDTIFTWDTTSAPDGTYLVRIVASDAAGNAPGTALTDARDSAPFTIDNSPPRIAVEPAGDETSLAFVVTDAQSPVERVEYRLDTDRWQVVYPVDGIPDTREERFVLTLEAGSASRLVIRASDAMDNTATADVPRP